MRQQQKTVGSSLGRSPKTARKLHLSHILIIILCSCVVIFGFAFAKFQKEHEKILKNNKAKVVALNDAPDHHHDRPKKSRIILNEDSSQKNAGGGSSSSSTSKYPQYHMVFSTGCTPFQDWQAMMFFYHAWKVKQPGTVTRIASGCTDDTKMTEMKRQFHEQIKVLSPDNFHLHFTPNWGFTSETNKYFNKPFGLLDWMEKILGYPNSRNQEEDDSIIMILDPDMMLLRPLTHRFDDFPKEYWVDVQKPMGRPIKMQVEHGWPISQRYGFGEAWLRSFRNNRTFVLQDENSPVYDITNTQASQWYPSGPPYLATARDMYKIVKQWVEFVQRIGTVFEGMMAEMYAYSTASAHLGLPHQLTEKFMVSDVGMVRSEGWDFLQDVHKQDSCQPTNPPLHKMPYVLHFCQRYALGRWFVGKYKLPTDFFTCEAPLIMEPPLDVGIKYDWFIYPNNKEHEEYFGPTQVHESEMKIKANAYAMCTMIHGLNEVATHYKKHHCTDNINYEQSFHFQEKDETFTKFLKEGGLGKIV